MSEFDQVWEHFKRWVKEPGNGSSFLGIDERSLDQMRYGDLTAEAAVQKFVLVNNCKGFHDQLLKRCKNEMPEFGQAKN